jgi:hypothetical protein
MSGFAEGQIQKLVLTWIGTENQPRMEPRLRLEFADDPRLEDSPVRCLEATLSVCDEPRCHCSNIRLQWQPSPPQTPGEPVGPAREFLYNLNKNAILQTPELKADPASLNLAASITAELSALERQQLREWFTAAKIGIIQSTPTDEIDISGLPSADGGEMIGFVEVFPCDFALAFTYNNEPWTADEQYCVQPGCGCTATILTFLNLADASGKKIHLRNDSPALRYDYATDASKPATRMTSKSPPLPDLLAALKQVHPDLNAQLKLRHGILQALYARHYQERAQSRLQLQARAPNQTGRNEPCPCGSGRKYKQCCLGKPHS